MSAYTQLIVHHISTGYEVVMPIRVNNFIQDAKPSFTATEVYGRMDPIFTYQNTKRTFQLTCEFARYSELISKWCPRPQKTGPAIPSKMSGAGSDKVKKYAAETKKMKTTEGKAHHSTIQTRALTSLYRFMYPLYVKTTHENNIITRQLKGPPILRISIPGVLNPSEKGGSLVFVPENFTVSTGMAAAGKQQFTFTSPQDMAFMAPRGSYGFTLGGTILHENAPPAYEVDKDGNLAFTDVTFPFGVGATYNQDQILGGGGD